MIVSNLYATDSSVIHPAPNTDIIDEFTARVETLGEDKVGSYYLGWIKKENLPSNCLCSTLVVDGEEGSRTFTWNDITDEDNFPCGYISGYIAGANQFNTTISSRLQYINKLYPEYSCEMDNIDTKWALYLYDSTGEHLLKSDSQTVSIPIKTFAKLCMGYSGVSFTITFFDQSSWVRRPFTLTSENLGHLMDDSDEYLEWLDEDDWAQTAHCKLRVALTGFLVPITRIIGNSQQYDMLRAQWFVKTTCTLNGEQYDHYAYSQSPDTIYPYNDGSPYIGSGYASYPYIFEYPFNNLNNYTNKIIQFGIHGEFTETQIRSFISSQNLYMVNNNILGTKDYSSSTSARFYPLYKFTDIFKCLCLQYRTNIDVTNNPGDYLEGYIPGRTYATDVTPEDEFLAKWKTGDINDPAFKESLRPWQYENFQENDFTEDDIPQPEPEPGGDDPGSDEPVDTPLVTGDDQVLQINRTLSTANDFITMYNITPPMLSIFGRVLWKSLIDYDPNDPTTIEVFKNFFTFINESVTGSVDIGSLLQFVVSVRQYPFNVAGLGITASAGDSIKLGTGKFPIQLGSGANVQVLTSTIGIIDCGTVTIADYRDFKLYNDFRDYLNTTVSAFLPYCGTVELNPIEVIHNTVHCYYAVDFYTGECTAYLTCTDGNHEWICGIKNGTIGVLIPVTATNSGQISARHQSDNAKDSALLASTMGNLFSTIANVATGNVAGAVGNIVGIAQNDAQQRQMDAERQGRSAVMAPSLSGGSGAAAFYQPDCASIMVRRGTYARDKIGNYPSTCAYPATTSGELSSFHGYTECYNVDVDKLNCNEEERAQVKMILETGVYLP